LNFARAFAAICRVGSASFEIVNPRNFRSPLRATALFASLTLSWSRVVRKRQALAMTRSPDRRLRT
jgi:hypothetical protein